MGGWHQLPPWRKRLLLPCPRRRWRSRHLQISRSQVSTMSFFHRNMTWRFHPPSDTCSSHPWPSRSSTSPLPLRSAPCRVKSFHPLAPEASAGVVAPASRSGLWRPAGRSDISPSRCGDKTAADAANRRVRQRAHLPDFRGPPRSRRRRRRSRGPSHLQQGPTSVDAATKRQRLRPIGACANGLTSPTSGGLRGREGADAGGPPPPT